MVNVGDRVGAVLGHDLVTGAVVADRGAERDVEVKRKRARFGFVVSCPRADAILGLTETLVELHRRRIRGIPGTGLVVALNEIGIEDYLLFHVCSHSFTNSLTLGRTPAKALI